MPAEITCPKCKKIRSIRNSGYILPSGSSAHDDVIRAVLTRGFCETKSMFELTGNSVTFTLGQFVMGELEETIPKTVLDLLDEARLYFYGAAFLGVVAMCRSCVEESLHQRGIQGKDLAKKIESAQKKVKLLGEAEVT